MERLRKKTILKFFTHNEEGIALIETLVSLAVLGAITTTFLSGLATASTVTLNIDERVTADNLARSQMESTKTAEYVYETASYAPAIIPVGPDYNDYSAVINAEPLNNPDDGIQKITVIIKKFTEEKVRLEGYKVDK